MSQINDGGPAFPCQYVEHLPGGAVVSLNSSGMSLRDYAAIEIAAGMCARTPTPNYDHRAQMAYALADALIAEKMKG